MIMVDNSGFNWSKIGNKTDNNKCRFCGAKHVYYSWKYDALFCGACNSWIEKKCNDKYCENCSSRPRTPVEELRVVEYQERKHKTNTAGSI